MTYRELYFQLFRMLRDATEALERGEFFAAREILIEAQLTGEEANMAIDILPEKE